VEYSAQGKFKEAKEKFERALKVDPFFMPAKICLKIIEDANKQKKKSKMAIYLFKGAAHFSKREWNEAISDCTGAIEINPIYAMAYTNRGAPLPCQGDHSELFPTTTEACYVFRHHPCS
jgi:tetratricopeptide (TPR) repeat protein